MICRYVDILHYDTLYKSEVVKIVLNEFIQNGFGFFTVAEIVLGKFSSTRL